MNILDDTGDTRIEWDPNVPGEVQTAREAFQRMKDKKYLIYKTDRNGNKGELLRTFDPNAERIICSPQPVGG